MIPKVKPKKCRRCKREFVPVSEWQKYCGRACRAAAYYARHSALIRKARKIINAQEQGAA